MCCCHCESLSVNRSLEVASVSPGPVRSEAQCPAAEESNRFKYNPEKIAGLAARVAIGAHVDEPVGGLDDVQVVLDDDDSVARDDFSAVEFGVILVNWPKRPDG